MVGQIQKETEYKIMMTAEVIQTLITTVGTIFVALITIVVKTKMDNDATQKKKLKDESFSKDDIAEIVEIQKWLDGFRRKYDFERTSIFQFHNGGKFFHGKSMKKFSMTYESVAPGFEKLKTFQQNVLTSEYPGWMNLMLTQKCFSTNVEEVDDFKDKKEWQSLGILQFVTIPVYSINGYLVGFIVGHNISQIDTTIMDREEDLIEDSQIIAGYIAQS